MCDCVTEEGVEDRPDDPLSRRINTPLPDSDILLGAPSLLRVAAVPAGVGFQAPRCAGTLASLFQSPGGRLAVGRACAVRACVFHSPHPLFLPRKGQPVWLGMRSPARSSSCPKGTGC